MSNQMEKGVAERILEMTGTYDKAILKKAYMKKVRTCHPDVAKVNGLTQEEAERITKQVNEAFVVLSGLFDPDVTVVTCDGYRDEGTASTGTRPSADAQANRTSTGATAATGTTSKKTAPRPQPAAPRPRPVSTDFEYEYVADTQTRPANVRNMEAARRYTRIVTSPLYVRLNTDAVFAGGLFAVVLVGIAFVLGALAIAAGSVGNAAAFVPWAAIGGAVAMFTGFGAEVTRGVADIHAVNKATQGL